MVGHRLVPRLLHDGHLVHTYGRRPSADPQAVHHSGSITDEQTISEVMHTTQPEWVIHLATDTRHTWVPTEIIDQYTSNIGGTCAVLRSALKHPPAAFVSLGTLEEYGNNPTPFTEDMTPRPPSPYSITKAITSTWVSAVGQHGFPATVLRIPVSYGPGQHSASFIGSVFEAIRRSTVLAMTPGEQTRNFLFVDDAVEAIIAAARHIEVCRGRILNAGPEWEISLRDAVQMIADITGAKHFADIGRLPYRPNEQMRYVASSKTIYDLTGWKAQTSFREGIQKTWEHYRTVALA